MKRKHTVPCFIIILLVIFFSSCKKADLEDSLQSTNETATRSTGELTHYYWYKGTKISLKLMEDKRYILYKSSNKAVVENKLRASGIAPTSGKEIVLPSTITNRTKRYTEKYLWDIIQTKGLSNLTMDLIYDAPCFKSIRGDEMHLTHQFYVKLKKEGDLSILQELAASNMIDIIGNNVYLPLWYTLECTKGSKGNTLEMANLFYKTKIFEACEPDLIPDQESHCSLDPLFSAQWNLRNIGQNGWAPTADINFCNAKSITVGSDGVVVAVIDKGIELTHPELNLYSKSYDAMTGTSPSKIYGEHGTQCAGIIGAKINRVGMAGIAPYCPLMSISCDLFFNFVQSRADAINYAWSNEASVISCSWGASESSMIDDAINNALIHGRNGKGCVVVFSAGNVDSEFVAYPANSNPDIIAVGAMSPCFQRKSPNSCDGDPVSWGSSYGAQLDVMAPGIGIPTTTLNGGVMTYFKGTSAAAPHVAAVAALMLSVNPSLTQKQVTTIIESTARKVGNYNYQSIPNRPNGRWHKEMGYGLLDAFAALEYIPKIKNYSNIIIVGNTSVSGDDIWSENVEVRSSKLTIRAQNTNLTKLFTVQQGAELEITN